MLVEQKPTHTTVCASMSNNIILHSLFYSREGLKVSDISQAILTIFIKKNHFQERFHPTGHVSDVLPDYWPNRADHYPEFRRILSRSH